MYVMLRRIPMNVKGMLRRIPYNMLGLTHMVCGVITRLRAMSKVNCLCSSWVLL